MEDGTFGVDVLGTGTFAAARTVSMRLTGLALPRSTPGGGSPAGMLKRPRALKYVEPETLPGGGVGGPLLPGAGAQLIRETFPSRLLTPITNRSCDSSATSFEDLDPLELELLEEVERRDLGRGVDFLRDLEGEEDLRLFLEEDLCLRLSFFFFSWSDSES